VIVGAAAAAAAWHQQLSLPMQPPQLLVLLFACQVPLLSLFEAMLGPLQARPSIHLALSQELL